jgi:UDP-N-acetylglucosamine--N-acetylmuramyl-(pentapeptide) pyrophosphoryl-undecaprenol N-acetylglucosamine transferase
MYLGLPGDIGRRDGRRLFTGTPLRPEMYDVDRRRARAELDLQDDVPVVLVTGGSQGAETLNRLAPLALGSLGLPLQVLHLSGNGRDEAVRRSYAQSGDRGLRACVRPMAMDMDRLLGAADLVVCRGGGTTVAELMAAGRPAVIVPYPHHRDRQQVHNADVLVRAGAAVVLEEKALDALALATVLGSLLRDRARLSAMGQAARRLAVADPCAAILADMQLQGGLA